MGHGCRQVGTLRATDGSKSTYEVVSVEYYSLKRFDVSESPFHLHIARPDECGRKYAGISTQIVGGEPAEEYAWPWQVAMLENGEHICGASLIDPWWIITAAHCV